MPRKNAQRHYISPAPYCCCCRFKCYCTALPASFVMTFLFSFCSFPFHAAHHTDVIVGIIIVIMVIKVELLLFIKKQRHCHCSYSWFCLLLYHIRNIIAFPLQIITTYSIDIMITMAMTTCEDHSVQVTATAFTSDIAVFLSCSCLPLQPH